MYARVSVTTSTRKEALVVPATSVVDLGGRRGVFTPLNDTAVFRALEVGTEQGAIVEVLGGLSEGDTVITTGSSALRDGDRIVPPGGANGARGRRGAGAAADGARDGGSAGAAEARRGGSRDGGAREGGTRPADSGREGGTREGGSRDGRGRRGAPPAPAGTPSAS
jgi:hypothetical protein